MGFSAEAQKISVFQPCQWNFAEATDPNMVENTQLSKLGVASPLGNLIQPTCKD